MSRKVDPEHLTWTGPIEDIQTDWDDGHLSVETILRTEPPVHLNGWRGWDRDRHGNHREPWYGDRTALTRVTLRARLLNVSLPAPPEDVSSRIEVVLTAKAAVASLANAIDNLLEPAVDALYGAGPVVRAIANRRGDR